jgi:hypothetical protein
MSCFALQDEGWQHSLLPISHAACAFMSQQQQPRQQRSEAATSNGSSSSSSSTSSSSGNSSSNSQRSPRVPPRAARNQRNIRSSSSSSSSSRLLPSTAAAAVHDRPRFAGYLKSQIEPAALTQTAQQVAHVLGNALSSVVASDMRQGTGLACLEYMQQQTGHPGLACVWQLLFVWLGGTAQQQHGELHGKSPASVSAALLPAAAAAAGSSRTQQQRGRQQQEQQLLVPAHHVRFLEVMGVAPWRIKGANSALFLDSDCPLTFVLPALATLHAHVHMQHYVHSPYCSVTESGRGGSNSSSSISSSSSSGGDLQQQQQQSPWEVAEYDSRVGLVLLLLLELQLLAPTAVMLSTCCHLMSDVVEVAYADRDVPLQHLPQQQQQQQLGVELLGVATTAMTVLTHVLSFIGPLVLQPPACRAGPVGTPGENFTAEQVRRLHCSWAALVAFLLFAGERKVVCACLVNVLCADAMLSRQLATERAHAKQC